MVEIRRVLTDYHKTVANPDGLPLERELLIVAFPPNRSSNYAGILQRYDEVHGEHGKLMPHNGSVLYNYVLEGSESFIARFTEAAACYMPIDDNLEVALAYLQDVGIGCDIITRASSGDDILLEQMFETLRLKNLADYFENVYTLKGILSAHGGNLKQEFVLVDKEELYPHVIDEMANIEIGPEEILVIGDDLEGDIKPLEYLGIWAVHYTGFQEASERPEAQDYPEGVYPMDDFFQLKGILDAIRRGRSVA